MIRKIAFLITIVIIAALAVQVVRTADLLWLSRLEQGQADILPTLSSPVALLTPENYLRLVVLYLDEDTADNLLRENIYHTLRMAKLSTSYVNVRTAEASAHIDAMNTADLLVVATELRIGDNNDLLVRSIDNFTHRGGNTVFLVRSYLPALDAVVGIAQNRGFAREPAVGINLEAYIFPGIDAMSLPAFVQSVLDVDLRDESRLLATADDGSPLIWTSSHGEGEVLYVNSTMFQAKKNRGLLLQCLAYLPDFFVSTIFNAVIFNIDDFPAPISLGRHPQIFSEYFMTTIDFFRQVWWPDTYNFARRFNLRLTGLGMLTFNSDTTSPLDPPYETTLRQWAYFGRRLLEAGGELGLHGYNHQSLAKEGQMRFADYGYTPWESQQTMEEGLRIVAEAIRSLFGNIRLFSYVPPSNIVSPEGRLAIRNVFPDIRVFAGLYTGEPEPGLLLQEFGRDPYVPEVVSFPRFSAGYTPNDGTRWAIYNAVAHYGLVHHFVHPDDVLDEARSGGYSWEEMDRQIHALFAEIRQHFPFLRPMTLSEAHSYFVKTENLEVFVTTLPNEITLHYSHDVTPVYHFLRLREGSIVRVEGGTFQLFCRNNNIYLIEGQAGQVRILTR